MKHKRLIALLFILAVGAAASPRRESLRQQATDPAPVVIPFELVNRHILFKVSINNSAPLSFILDTGDKFAVVSLARARALGLNLQGEINIGGAGAGSLKGAYVRDAKLTVPGLPGHTEPVVLTLPLADLAAKFGQDIDGIIGGDFMKHFVVELDYQARVLRFHDKDQFVYSGSGESIPLSLNADGHATIPAEVAVNGREPIKGNFVVDIGSGGGLVLHSPTTKAEHLPEPTQKTIRVFGAGGAGGKISGRIGRLPALTIGKFRIDEPVTIFSSDQRGAFANGAQQGNIGQRILSKFTIFFDYAHARMILEPNASFKNAIGAIGGGLALVAEGAAYQTFRVEELLEDSPATEAGLQKDDIILAVNDRPATAFTLSSLNEMFEQPRAQKLSIRRGAETLQVTLTPRKLI